MKNYTFHYVRHNRCQVPFFADREKKKNCARQRFYHFYLIFIEKIRAHVLENFLFKLHKRVLQIKFAIISLVPHNFSKVIYFSQFIFV